MIYVKEKSFCIVIEHFLLWVLKDPFHVVTLGKYFMHMRVKLNFLFAQIVIKLEHNNTDPEAVGKYHKIIFSDNGTIKLSFFFKTHFDFESVFIANIAC